MTALFREQLERSPLVFNRMTGPYYPWEKDGFSQPLITPYIERGDAVLYYSFIRRVRPKKIVEIGCGYSTHFAADAIRKNGDDTTIWCIDPGPRTELPKELFVHHSLTTVEKIPPEAFSLLGSGDILFIDSSHSKAEVQHHIERIFPLLPDGIFIQHHDFVTMQDLVGDAIYPEYEESRVLRNFYEGALDRYTILLSNYYILKTSPEIVQRFPDSGGAGFASLWVRKGVWPEWTNNLRDRQQSRSGS